MCVHTKQETDREKMNDLLLYDDVWKKRKISKKWNFKCEKQPQIQNRKVEEIWDSNVHVRWNEENGWIIQNEISAYKTKPINYNL